VLFKCIVWSWDSTVPVAEALGDCHGLKRGCVHQIYGKYTLIVMIVTSRYAILLNVDSSLIW
jgi:hypothetical protein